MLCSICFVFNHFLRSRSPEQASRRLDDSSGHGNPPTNGSRIRYGIEIRGCNLGAALSVIKLGEGEHLLGSGGAAGDSFVGFDRIFERYCVHSWQL